jgi:4-hydroxy-2-oxoheptanedioate aldolase
MRKIYFSTALLFVLFIQCKTNTEETIPNEKSVVENYGEEASYTPKRINKCIELFEQGQPVYYKGAYGGYEEGKNLAKTWADYIVYNMEHKPLDFTKLHDFMKALVEHGPTPSGHRTPTVIVVLPLVGLDSTTVKSGGWMVEQALAQGVHGVHLVRARKEGAVREFIQAGRYPIHKQKIELIGEGLRGWGSHKYAAWVWGVDEEEYLLKADAWPLNPKGELMFGAKIEDITALENSEQTLQFPGLAFAEHGPRDLGFSYGYLEGRADPPVPQEVNAAGQKVLDLCNKNGLYFLDNVLPNNVREKIDWGVMIGAGSNKEAALEGREYTKRKMPW